MIPAIFRPCLGIGTQPGGTPAGKRIIIGTKARAPREGRMNGRGRTLALVLVVVVCCCCSGGVKGVILGDSKVKEGAEGDGGGTS